MLKNDIIDYFQKPEVVQAINSNNFEDVFLRAPVKTRGELVNIFNEANIDFLSSLRIIYPGTFSGVGKNTLDLSQYKNPEIIAAFAFRDCDYETIILPESVKVISHKAFADCRCTYIDISKTKLSVLPASVFEDSIYLEKVILCDGLQFIGYDCFRNCEKLKEIKLPKTIARIERNVFYRCDQLSEIKYEGTVADWKKVEKDDAYDTESVWDLRDLKVICTDGSTYFLGD